MPKSKKDKNNAAEETIEACQLKIQALVNSVQQGNTAPDDIPDVASISKELARLYIRMGDILLAGKDADRAITCYVTVLQLDPGQIVAHLQLPKTGAAPSMGDIMRRVFTEMLAGNPRDVALLSKLGELHYNIGKTEQALDYFKRALEIEPDNASNLYSIANLQELAGDLKAADASYRHAIKIQPLIIIPANKIPPDFSVLVLFAPLLFSTTISDLVDKAPYETHIFSLMPNAGYDLALLKKSGQIVLNIISDADQGRALLPEAIRLVDQLGLPVINHPSQIQRTGREEIERLLRDIPGCRLAKIVRHVAGTPASAKELRKNLPFSTPLLARPAGTHRGDNFEKIDSFDELEAFIRKFSDTDLYLMEYIDYKSADGYFRKYRLFFIDDLIMAYHLAIGSHWKIHHNTTDMGDHQWMQDEEKAFLEKPEAVFSPKHYKTLRAIRKAIGLEYFGIDCGLDAAGNLVVFEANASMAAHQHNEEFPYKTPFVDAIKHAFDEMLKRRAKK